MTRRTLGIRRWNSTKEELVYPIVLKFNDTGKWRYKSVQEIDYNVTVKDHTGQVHNLPQKQHNESACTLGVQLVPGGNNSAMVDTLRQKAEEWKSNIQSGHLNCHEAWLVALNLTIMKRLLYPPLALTLMEEQCTKIMVPVIYAGLKC